VLIEFAVNDASHPDATCIRNLESIVRRLLSTDEPPLVLFVNAAARDGANHARHLRVARHYALPSVDLQAAVDEQLEESGLGW
ncbi:hypothetical protein R0K05_23585, partial [Planococcus sp. SIMBA_160]